MGILKSNDNLRNGLSNIENKYSDILQKNESLKIRMDTIRQEYEKKLDRLKAKMVSIAHCISEKWR
jgi:hypothetical protein